MYIMLNNGLSSSFRRPLVPFGTTLGVPGIQAIKGQNREVAQIGPQDSTCEECLAPGIYISVADARGTLQTLDPLRTVGTRLICDPKQRNVIGNY